MVKYCITTGENGRCVLIGDGDKEPVCGEPYVLRNARMVLKWSTECSGLLGLLSKGPKGDTRITAPVASTGVDVVKQWASVEAVDALQDWPNA